ncbi:MAG: hypothetical protein ACFNUU_09785, partial [Campylobacter sp.]|uniref:hypothetical protein n=1 Tax=Campylobacter sp. TaxID=205 RepID=UPI003607E98D
MGLFEICVIIALFILIPDLFLIALTVLIIAGIIYLGILSLPILLAIGAIYIVVAIFKAFFTKITQPNDIVELDEESQELFFKHIDDMGKKHIRKFFKYIFYALTLVTLALLAYNEIGVKTSYIYLAQDEVAKIEAYKLKGDERGSELTRVSKILRDNDYADGLSELLTHKESGKMFFRRGDELFPIEGFFYDISYAKYKV